MTSQLYNTFKYGTSHKYGATVLGTVEALSWAIEVDWDGDGVFDGVNEAFYLMKAPTIQRGRRNMLRPSGQGFETLQTGKCNITLSNHDGRYDAWNTSSPLYPNVEAGKDVRVRVKDISTGVIYNRFYGIIQDIEPSGYGANAKVTIRCEDAIRVLRDISISATSPAAFGYSPTVTNCLEKLFQSINFPSRWGWTLDTNPDTIRIWYASGDRSVATELEDLALSFLGYFFISSAGMAIYYNRQSHTTSVETISESEILKDIGNPQPWVIKRDVVKIIVHPRIFLNGEGFGVIVWLADYGEYPGIAAGNTLTFFIDYIYNGFPVYIEGSIAGTVWFATTLHGTIDFGLPTQYSGAVTNFGFSGKAAINNPNAVTVYFTRQAENPSAYYSEFHGFASYNERTETVSNPRDPTTLINPRQFVSSSMWYQDIDQAATLADLLQPLLSAKNKTPIITFENRFSKQFTPDVFDVITLDVPTLGINSEDFRVGFIDENPIGESTQAIRTTFYLEPFLS